MPRVAVIGLGDIADVHVPILKNEAGIELAAVCDIDPTRAQSVPGIPFYTDYRAMLAEIRPDCVHICLPHYLHYPVAKDCVEAGADVLCEKPLALNTEQALAYRALEQAHPARKICICLQNRYNETFERLMQIKDSGEFGRVTGVKGLVAWYRSPEYYAVKPWRGTMEKAGGGAMINQSIHTMDLMQLLGGPIDSIRGSIDNLLDYGIEVEDTASASICFKSGARGLFFVSVANYGNDNVEIAVEFEKASFVIRDNVLLRTDGSEAPQPLIEDAKMPGEKFYYGASHLKLFRQFYRCLAEDSQDYIHVRDAVTSIRMIDAVRGSSADKKPWRFEE